MSSTVYLDYNAGAPVRPHVIAAMSEVWAEGGNPSSVHGWGRRARARVERARDAVAAAVDADPRGVVFTSGGTEANALVLRGCGRSRIFVSAIEHPSVLNGAEQVSILPVGSDGVIDLNALDRMLAGQDDALVSVMAANNETGIVQPIDRIVEIAHNHGALMHCDAAQALGRVAVSVACSHADFLTLSAHKIGGPVGVGALVMRNADFALSPIIAGGGQERRLRGGTENTPGIVGFGVAAPLAVDELAGMGAIAEMRDWLETQILARVPDAVIVGRNVPRLPNTICLAVPGIETRTQVMSLDLDGIMVGAGAACSSGKMGESGVLKAMGVDTALARSAIRVSLGWATNRDHVNAFLESWIGLVQRKGLQVVDAAAAA